mmetsp:Transcript_5405/g.15763  ORF Transcript_5405/g.15763 Transcript_5405/m.15763 type:complete len:428 (-) Transcript_5405:234-1517(-)|eukprot:CAMPEP_0113546312 /NCGR_PEP_ID=MMETSP0015_2-20120614/11736_1 /TAXON_ID=2838 /ORGANISM="Odontella" /LENGTH=427 /DNA_ID=CAMNT_0000446753 /DNA_START=127 /DNA_END=1410 /DNA_ORIENTATION=+ /assembly_acc=CAM_ASM_000160
MSSPTSITKEDPLRMLVMSSCRPSSPALGSSYVILAQHSVCLPERLTAAVPSSSAQPQSKRTTRGHIRNRREDDLDEAHIFRLAGLLSPAETAERDGSGGWLVRSVFMELCERTLGHVVHVKAADNMWLPTQSSLVNLFERNGIVVDLSVDPCGWCDRDEAGAETSEENGAGHRYLSMTNLADVARAIEQAANIVHTRIAQNTEIHGDNSERTVHPIPIVFDSISPLIAMHGLSRIIIFLQHLRENQAKIRQGSEHFIRSPIVIPVLGEVLSPHDHRRLEDFCDATLVLDRGDIQIARNSSRAGSVGGKLMREVQHFAVLRRHNEMENEESRAMSKASSNKNKGNAFGLVSSQDGKIETEPSPPNRRRPTLQHEDESCRSHTHRTKKAIDQVQQRESRHAKPRIFVEDDDPEFDDLDEEDPDDDLDL